MASDKKPRAVPNSNPLGLTAREIEIAILAWRCLGDDGKIDKQELCRLAGLGNADSAGRMFRTIKAKIIAALVGLSAAPATPGAGGDDATAAAADPDSPSVRASQKKKTKAAGGKVAGRKRNIKEAEDDDNDGEAGKNKGDGGERPTKIPKHVKGKPVVTLKKLEAAEGDDGVLETGEI